MPEQEEDSLFNATRVWVSLITLLVAYLIYGRISGRDSWQKYEVPQGKIGLNLAESVDDLLKDGVDTIGVHLGSMMLITCDLHLLREILVKKFNNFTDRSNIVRTRSLITRGLAFLEGSNWKRMRHILSPFFSTSRMKRMSPCIDASAQKLAEVLETCAKEDRLLEAKHTLGQYTSGIIARTGFGLATDCLGESDNEFTWHCKNLVKVRTATSRVIQMILFRIPRLHRFCLQKLKLDFLDSVNSKSDEYFNKVLQASIHERLEVEKSDAKKPGDFLQGLVSAHLASEQPNASKSISKSDVIGHSLLILFAAFDTTSTTLQLCLALLAMHPDIQERVYREIMEVISIGDRDRKIGDGESNKPQPGLNHEQLQQLHYTQRVIEETLRLYPPATFISRKANRTTTINLFSAHTDTPHEDPESSYRQQCSTVVKGVNPMNTSFGIKNKDLDNSSAQAQPTDATINASREKQCSGSITVPEGAFILIPVAKIHRDPRHYSDPEKFDPDRFLPEKKAIRDPLAFLPFGQGPRQCIGMRMAYLEIKTALVYVLRKVRFEVNDITEPVAGGKISYTATGVLVLDKPIKLAVKLRRPSTL